MIVVRRNAGSDHRIGAEGAGNAAALGVADILCLAGAPTFAAMALLTGISDAGPLGMLCSAAHGPLSGMAPMYWLMSVSHLAPWLRLIAGRRGGGHRS
jgi:hypothetical protein